LRVAPKEAKEIRLRIVKELGHNKLVDPELEWTPEGWEHWLPPCVEVAAWHCKCAKENDVAHLKCNRKV